MEDQLSVIKEAIIGGKHHEIENLIQGALEQELDPDQIINHAMIAAMDVVGARFADNQIYVPEMLVSALTMKKGLNIIKPLLAEDSSASKETIMMCTVKGDMHDIGKNLVTMMLEGAGFAVIDLGVDMSVENVAAEVKKVRPAVLGLSALLTTTMPEMKRVIEALEQEGLRGHVKVMVGGAPVDAAFAEGIGADGYGKDATAAVQLARRLVAETS
jgi:5-methyltetrahydrofolate--homocysteine methyltransferase